jgi:hypothetical protein
LDVDTVALDTCKHLHRVWAEQTIKHALANPDIRQVHEFLLRARVMKKCEHIGIVGIDPRQLEFPGVFEYEMHRR